MKRWTLYRMPDTNWMLKADDMGLSSRAETVEVVAVEAVDEARRLGAEEERERLGGRYQSVVAAARFLVGHSAGHPSRPSAQRSCWDALGRALAALDTPAPSEPKPKCRQCENELGEEHSGHCPIATGPVLESDTNSAPSEPEEGK